jgi:predicted small lipoprotein YifL
VARRDVGTLTKALVLTLVAAAIGLSACGRKGPLEPPPGAAAVAPQADEATPPKPDKDFILDPLLD